LPNAKNPLLGEKNPKKREKNPAQENSAQKPANTWGKQAKKTVSVGGGREESRGVGRAICCPKGFA